ncbi:MAG: cytochrome P450 [Candidatus Binatia bacterium]|nr:MAG: cytochrome P450 [Candidatus Binatia bacterium]
MTAATEQTFDLDTIDIVDPDRYARFGYPHAEWAYLRRHAPLFWYDRPNVDPFWAVTKRDDIVWISKQPSLFRNAPRLAVFTHEYEAPPEDNLPVRHLLNMDPPEHAKYRHLVSRHFTPRAVRRLAPEVERIAREAVASLEGRTECDFVQDVSAKVPLAVIAELLGVPRSDWELLFRWTNEVIGSADPEFQQGKSTMETVERARIEVFEYFQNMVEERRKKPREDIVSVLANARLDGEPLPVLELLSYFFLLVVAGNETTRNATTGGLLAFLEHPEEWEKLRRDPALLPSAVEEIVRWTSPVIQFCRTAVEDVEIRGRKIRRGDSLCLFYPSAGRDEDWFEDPDRFRIDRNPNPHISFGVGEHFCLGAHLARLELEAVFRELLRRLGEAELAGPVERLRSSFVGGIKHMPIRYELVR